MKTTGRSQIKVIITACAADLRDMKIIVFLILSLITASSFSQDVSFSKPGKNIYAEMPNPAKADLETWSKLKSDVNVSFADDNIRYPKQNVPTGLIEKTWNAIAWKGEKIHTQLLVWTKIDIPALSHNGE